MSKKHDNNNDDVFGMMESTHQIKTIKLRTQKDIEVKPTMREEIKMQSPPPSPINTAKKPEKGSLLNLRRSSGTLDAEKLKSILKSNRVEKQPEPVEVKDDEPEEVEEKVVKLKLEPVIATEQSKKQSELNLRKIEDTTDNIEEHSLYYNQKYFKCANCQHQVSIVSLGNRCKKCSKIFCARCLCDGLCPSNKCNSAYKPRCSKCDNGLFLHHQSHKCIVCKKTVCVKCCKKSTCCSATYYCYECEKKLSSCELCKKPYCSNICNKNNVCNSCYQGCKSCVIRCTGCDADYCQDCNTRHLTTVYCEFCEQSGKKVLNNQCLMCQDCKIFGCKTCVTVCECCGKGICSMCKFLHRRICNSCMNSQCCNKCVIDDHKIEKPCSICGSTDHVVKLYGCYLETCESEDDWLALCCEHVADKDSMLEGEKLYPKCNICGYSFCSEKHIIRCNVCNENTCEKCKHDHDGKNRIGSE